MSRVLLTNGQLRKTLAAVRSLGAKGIKTISVDETRFTPTAFSKYCSKSLVCPNARKNPQGFYHWLLEILRKYPCDVILPMDEDTLSVVLEHREELEKICTLPIPLSESFGMASDKGKAIQLAEASRVPIPETILPENMDSLIEQTVHLRYPLIVKPRKGSGGRGMKIINSQEELMSACTKANVIFPNPIIQEYIREGDIYEVALLYDQENCLKASYVMKHVRKYPLFTGPSTVQESVDFPEIIEYAKRIMENLPWYGIITMEFLVNNDKKDIRFIEINPRFWNSLQAAIQSGVDFPWLLYKIAMGHDCEEVHTYQTGVICRNLLPGDILHYMTNHERKYMKPPFFAGKKQNVYDDIISKDDPGPVLGFVLACARYLFDIKMWKFMFRR